MLDKLLTGIWWNNIINIQTKCTKYITNTINIFIGTEDQKHFIDEYQEHCDVIQKLNDTEKWGMGNR